MRKLWLLLLLVLACFILWRSRAPVTHPPGVLVKVEPSQTDFVTTQAAVKLRGWTLEPVAAFSLEARVLALKRYTDDFSATLATHDAALGWGPMSDSAVLDRLEITQKHRFYRWRFWGTAPIPEKEIVRHSANMHLIPADDGIRATLDALRPGEIIRLGGSLVNATHPQADKPWRTSLTRGDRGEGACEIVLLKSVGTVPPTSRATR